MEKLKSTNLGLGGKWSWMVKLCARYWAAICMYRGRFSRLVVPSAITWTMGCRGWTRKRFTIRFQMFRRHRKVFFSSSNKTDPSLWSRILPTSQQSHFFLDIFLLIAHHFRNVVSEKDNFFFPGEKNIPNRCVCGLIGSVVMTQAK